MVDAFARITATVLDQLGMPVSSSLDDQDVRTQDRDAAQASAIE